MRTKVRLVHALARYAREPNLCPLQAHLPSRLSLFFLDLLVVPEQPAFDHSVS